MFIQALGFWFLSSLAGGSPYLTADAYLQIALAHTTHAGIHLARLFPPGSELALASVAVMSVISLGSVVYRVFLRLARRNAFQPPSLEWPLVLAILALWSLLLVYHGPWDGVLIILFIAVCVHALAKPGLAARPPTARAGLAVLLAGSILLMCLPSLPGQAVAVLDLRPPLLDFMTVMSLTVLGMLGMALWLLYFTRPSAGERPVPLPVAPPTSTPTAVSPPPETSPTLTSPAKASVVAASTAPPDRASIRSGQSRRCPHCQQNQLVRVHRRWHDRLRQGMTMRLRCHACRREVLV